MTNKKPTKEELEKFANKQAEKMEYKEALSEEQAKYDELKNPQLLLNIIKELNKTIAGNEDIILVLVNKISLRLVKNAKHTSSNVILTEKSGSGKDYIVEQISNLLLPSGTYHHLTDISEKLLNYWDKPSPAYDTFYGHVLHIEDPEEDRLKAQSFKVRASGNNEIRIVDNGKPKYIKIVGKPVMIVTTLKGAIDIEGMRRWDSINTDITTGVTKLFMEKKTKAESGMLINKTNEILRDALHMLQPATVKIPYAPAIIKSIPNLLIMRTQIDKLFDYIRSSAVLHQYQREKNKDGEVLANLDDYEYGKFCFNQLKDFQGTALTKYEQEIVDELKQYPEQGLSIPELAPRVTVSRTALYGQRGNIGYMENLKEKGVLSTYTKTEDNIKTTMYTINEKFKIDMDLPDSKEVKNTFSREFSQISTINTPFLDTILRFHEFSECKREINNLRKKDGINPLPLSPSKMKNSKNKYSYNKNQQKGLFHFTNFPKMESWRIVKNNRKGGENPHIRPVNLPFDMIIQMDRYIEKHMEIKHIKNVYNGQKGG